MKSHYLALLAALVTLAAQADTDEIVVTAALRSEHSDEIPTVTLTKAADFLVQQVRLVNDSRSPDLRKQEIISTIEGMLKRAAGEKNIALSYGSGFLAPVNLTDESLRIIQDRGRADTSIVEIFVKITLAPSDDTKARIASLRKFIERTPPVGRTEVLPLGDVGLSVVNPERYRYDILARIAEDNARLIKAMGNKCQVKVGGLEGRVKWERTAVTELTLYIPYRVEISSCEYQA